MLTPEQSRDLLRRYVPEERASDDDLETLAQREERARKPDLSLMATYAKMRATACFLVG